MSAETFAEYAGGREDARFTGWLRERAEPDWTAATEHRFTRELAADELDDDAFRRYLVQDYAFVEALTGLVGSSAGQAPTVDARVELAGFLRTVGTDETDYFERAFDALDVPERDRTDPDLLSVTEAFADLLGRAAREGGYAETLAVLVPVEWVYLAWASRAAETPRPGRFYLAEWIDLHANPDFRAFVEWLRGQLDAVGPGLAPRRERRVERHFRRAVALEVAFFDAAYRGADAAE